MSLVRHTGCALCYPKIISSEGQNQSFSIHKNKSSDILTNSCTVYHNNYLDIPRYHPLTLLNKIHVGRGTLPRCQLPLALI